MQRRPIGLDHQGRHPEATPPADTEAGTAAAVIATVITIVLAAWSCVQVVLATAN